MSSPYSKLQSTPSRISLNILRAEPDKRQYTQGPLPLAVLLEGKFESVFNNRLPEEIVGNSEFKFQGESKNTKVIVISDADIIKNQVNWKTEEYFALGFDKYTQKQYANKEFLLNCIDYMLEESGLLEVRTKEFKMRMLDKQKVQAEKVKWQVINTAGPIGLVALFGIWQVWARRRRYSRKEKK